MDYGGPRLLRHQPDLRLIVRLKLCHQNGNAIIFLHGTTRLFFTLTTLTMTNI
jgi:hypothetical protein